MDAGSPPCSPQMPIFRSLRVERPKRTASSIRRPTPARRCGRMVGGVDLLLQVVVEERVHVVPGQAQRHLREVVGAETEELGIPGDLVRRECGPGNLDHGSHLVVDTDAGPLGHLYRDAVNDGRLVRQFLAEAHQGHHDLGLDRLATGLCRGGDGGFEDGARLGLGDFRVENAKPAAAAAEHRIDLARLRTRSSTTLSGRSSLAAKARRRSGSAGRNSCKGGSSRRMVTGRPAMTRNISSKSLALVRQQFRERSPALVLVGRKNHLPHRVDPLGLEEHVLGAAKSDAFRPVANGVHRHCRAIGVGAHLDAPEAVGPRHDGSGRARTRCCPPVSSARQQPAAPRTATYRALPDRRRR